MEKKAGKLPFGLDRGHPRNPFLQSLPIHGLGFRVRGLMYPPRKLAGNSTTCAHVTGTRAFAGLPM